MRMPLPTCSLTQTITEQCCLRLCRRLGLCSVLSSQAMPPCLAHLESMSDHEHAECCCSCACRSAACWPVPATRTCPTSEIWPWSCARSAATRCAPRQPPGLLAAMLQCAAFWCALPGLTHIISQLQTAGPKADNVCAAPGAVRPHGRSEALARKGEKQNVLTMSMWAAWVHTVNWHIDACALHYVPDTCLMRWLLTSADHPQAAFFLS